MKLRSKNNGKFNKDVGSFICFVPFFWVVNEIFTLRTQKYKQARGFFFTTSKRIHQKLDN
jgi:hypothetical protein